MNERKNKVVLYNLLFPFWMIMLFPVSWLVIIPGNLIIDSLVLTISMFALKIVDKKQWYKRYIFKIYAFGMLADLIGAAYLFLLMMVFEAGQMGDELYLTIPALIISAALIFVFNYFITFRKTEREQRLKLALIFAVVTAPYTFLIPSSWLYGF